MDKWISRSEEEANLFNPAFLSMLCHEAIKSYNDESRGDSPYILPFLIIPLILHKETRIRLPTTIRTQFITWCVNEKNSALKIGYDKRATAFVPYVKEAIMYSFHAGIIQFSKEGNIQIKSKLQSSKKELSEEVQECIKKAAFCGKWFAKSGDINTIMLFLGVRP